MRVTAPASSRANSVDALAVITIARPISSVQDGDVYLIFPELARPDGEWPVWFLSSKAPGAIAYASFGAMLAREREPAIAEIRER